MKIGFTLALPGSPLLGPAVPQSGHPGQARPMSQGTGGIWEVGGGWALQLTALGPRQALSILAVAQSLSSCGPVLVFL